MDTKNHLDYGYFGHDADIGIVGRGASIEEAFEAAACAAFALMTDLGAVKQAESVALEFEEADNEIALVRWLNLLLGHARERGMVFGRFWIERDGVRWRGGATGERWHAGLVRGIEVKGATLGMLAVTRAGATWKARCAVDLLTYVPQPASGSNRLDHECLMQINTGAEAGNRMGVESGLAAET